MAYDLQKRAKLRCMHLLEKRDYTEKQLRDKLRMGKTEYPPEMIDAAIEYVKSYHYVDDARYAAQYIDSRKISKSRRQMEQELFQKGIARDVAAQAFEEAEPIPEEELIRRWIEKRHYDVQTADMAETRRMYAFLARKGFQSDSILRALKKDF